MAESPKKKETSRGRGDSDTTFLEILADMPEIQQAVAAQGQQQQQQQPQPNLGQSQQPAPGQGGGMHPEVIKAMSQHPEVHQILEQILQEGGASQAPQAPQAAAQPELSVLNRFAIAQNPSLAGFITDRASGGAFRQQQQDNAQFEANQQLFNNAFNQAGEFARQEVSQAGANERARLAQEGADRRAILSSLGGASAQNHAGEVKTLTVSRFAAQNNPQMARLLEQGVPEGTRVSQVMLRNADGTVTTGDIVGRADRAGSTKDTLGGFMIFDPDTRTFKPAFDDAGNRIQKRPGMGDVAQAENAVDMLQTIREARQLAQDFSESGQSFGRALIQQGVRAGGVIDFIAGKGSGQALSERFGNPLLERLATVRDRLGIQLARLVEPNRLSDQDRDFALRQLGTPASLADNNEASLALFNAKLDFVQNALNSRLAERGKLRPDLVPNQFGEMVEPGVFSSVEDMLGVFEAAGQIGTSASGAGPAAGKVLPESSFDNIPLMTREAEMQRFEDDGGIIERGQ